MCRTRQVSGIRSRARLSKSPNRRRGEPSRQNPAERLVHDLRAHEFELELQNEQLRRAQAELSASRERYMDLYDFAPVGYFTLDRFGSILEANLTGAKLLGAERSTLVGGRFGHYVALSDRDRFHFYCSQVGRPGGLLETEIRLIPQGRPRVLRPPGGGPPPKCRGIRRPLHGRGERHQRQQTSRRRAAPATSSVRDAGHAPHRPIA